MNRSSYEIAVTRLALFQPDIAPNVGASMRLCACLGVGLDIIDPCGFPWDERKIRRAGMDYIDALDYAHFHSWEAFIRNRQDRRLVLLTTKAETSYTDFSFEKDDILIAGSEGAGVPGFVHNAAAARIAIPMKQGLRSLNVVTACAMVLGEKARQLKLCQ